MQDQITRRAKCPTSHFSIVSYSHCLNLTCLVFKVYEGRTHVLYLMYTHSEDVFPAFSQTDRQKRWLRSGELGFRFHITEKATFKWSYTKSHLAVCQLYFSPRGRETSSLLCFLHLGFGGRACFVWLHADALPQPQLLCFSPISKSITSHMHSLPSSFSLSLSLSLTHTHTHTHTQTPVSIYCKMSWCCILACIRQSRMDSVMEGWENALDLCPRLLDASQQRRCPHFIPVASHLIWTGRSP